MPVWTQRTGAAGTDQPSGMEQRLGVLRGCDHDHGVRLRSAATKSCQPLLATTRPVKKGPFRVDEAAVAVSATTKPCRVIATTWSARPTQTRRSSSP